MEKADCVYQFEEYNQKKFRIGHKSIQFKEIEKVLFDEFGYKKFKSIEQGLVTLKALNGESLFAVLATGSGKSTDFLLPAYLRRKVGFTLVISPLKAPP